MQNISFKYLVEDSPTAIAFFDTELNLVLHSHLWPSTFQLAHQTLKGKSFSSLFPQTTVKFKKLLAESLHGKSHQIKAQKITLGNTNTKWFDWRTVPIKNESGLIIGLLISASDVTLREKENYLLKMVKKVSRTGGWEINFATKEFYWTDVTKDIYEVPDDYNPILEKTILFYKNGDSRSKITASRYNAIQLGKPFDLEVEIVTAKGNTKWIRTKGESEFKNGQCVRFYGTVQDINDHKLAELKYHAEAERLKQATLASGVGTWQLSLPDRIAVWDDICFNLHHIDKTTCSNIYKSWVAVLPSEDFHRVVNEAYLNYTGEEKTIIEYQVIKPDKTLRDIRAIVTFLKIGNNFEVRAIGIVMDVTKEKEAERKLKEFAAIRKKQNEHLTGFAHMVSHDLRAHSTNLAMVANFLVEENDNDEKLKLMKMLKNATDSLVNTVSNLNTVVQSTAEVPAQMKELNLLEAIHRTQDNISSLLLENEVSVALKVSKKHIVKALPAYLDSILLNLFTNSIKYANPKQKPIIKIDSKKYQNSLRITFSDNGRGIDLEKHGRSIFGMHKTFHRNKDAMGVGLYLTKNQIQSMGGRISVQSKVDVGTTFILEFLIN